MIDLLHNNELLFGHIELKIEGEYIIGAADINFDNSFNIIKSKLSELDMDKVVDLKKDIEYCQSIIKNIDEVAELLNLFQKSLNETTPMYVHEEILYSLNRLLHIQNWKILNLEQCKEKKLTLQFILSILLRIGERIAIIKYIKVELVTLQIIINEKKIEKLKNPSVKLRKKKELYLHDLWNNSIKYKIQEELDFLKSKTLLFEGDGKLLWNDKNNLKLIALTEYWKDKKYLKPQYLKYEYQGEIANALYNSFNLKQSQYNSIKKQMQKNKLVEGDEILDSVLKLKSIFKR